ncbi:MAG: hypothetical protein GC204_15955 [Chloroflexi bacterium]|nr:hypothetical protein [Chloroflexota bacterium]
MPNPLRSLGFTPDKWRIWLHQISLNTVDAQSRRLPDRPPKGPISLIDPASLHPGSPALQDALRDRHRVYREAIGNQRKLVERMVIQFQQVEVKQLRAHWQMMSEARGKLPPVRYFIVAYPFRVVYAVPPASVILAFGTLPDKANYWNLLINGLKQLQN